jgi:hypothetical protein
MFPTVVGSVAAVIVPVATVLWFCIRTEMRAQILTLQVAVNERSNICEQRVTAIESRLRMDTRQCGLRSK